MPKDLSVRISYFYCASALSGAFSGLLAAGIAQMDGVGGLEGWRWIFILEGIVTVVLGVACFFFLIDTPALSTRWLNAEEIKFLELSMFIKQGGGFQEETSVRWKDIRMVLTNWRVYVQAYFLLCQSALSYGMASSFSNIISFSLMISRNQIHAANLDKGYGLFYDECPACLCSSVRCRCYLSHRFRQDLRSLLLENAFRGHSHGHCHSCILCHHIAQR